MIREKFYYFAKAMAEVAVSKFPPDKIVKSTQSSIDGLTQVLDDISACSGGGYIEIGNEELSICYNRPNDVSEADKKELSVRLNKAVVQASFLVGVMEKKNISLEYLNFDGMKGFIDPSDQVKKNNFNLGNKGPC